MRGARSVDFIVVSFIKCVHYQAMRYQTARPPEMSNTAPVLNEQSGFYPPDGAVTK
jgi:hypothetical protein